MNWRVEESLSRFVEDANAKVTGIWLQYEAIPRICCGIAMLTEDLVAGVDLVTSDGKGFISIVKSNLDQSPSFRLLSGRRILSFDLRTLNYVFCFMLKVIRDGQAEVDHIDIDVDLPSEKSRRYFVLHFPVFRPAVSENEARAILNRKA